MELTKRETAEMLGISQVEVIRRIQRGELKAHKKTQNKFSDWIIEVDDPTTEDLELNNHVEEEFEKPAPEPIQELDPEPTPIPVQEPIQEPEPIPTYTPEPKPTPVQRPEPAPKPKPLIVTKPLEDQKNKGDDNAKKQVGTRTGQHSGTDHGKWWF